jgi:serine/threonine-protein kinase
MSSLSPGQLVTSNVQLVQKLGEGGMGAVWVADHLTLHTRVAVKFMSQQLAMDGAANARFSREAAAAAQIKSPHVVQSYDHGVTAEGTSFIVMELLEGEDLGERIKGQGPLSMRDTGEILSQCCKALARAHALGIVHRDIKPDNIFLVNTEEDIFVKILDFGIAKISDPAAGFQMTSTGAMMGTPYYMSPEQFVNSKAVDGRADLWSLAVVVYHCLTGRVPFDGDTFPALCIAVDKGEFPPATQVMPALPPQLDAWFAKALSRNPADRFASARDLAESFHALLGDPSAARMSMVSVPDVSPLAVTGIVPEVPTFDGASVTASSPQGRSGFRVAVVLGLSAVLLLAIAVAVLLVAFGQQAEPAPLVADSAPTIESVSPPVQTEPPPSSVDAPASAEAASAVSAQPPVVSTKVSPVGTAKPTVPASAAPTASATVDTPPDPPPAATPTEVDRGF